MTTRLIRFLMGCKYIFGKWTEKLLIFLISSSGIEMTELKEKISQILNEVNVGSTESTESDVKSSCDLEEVIIKCKTRDYVDITDKLWQILKSSLGFAFLWFFKMFDSSFFQCVRRTRI